MLKKQHTILGRRDIGDAGQVTNEEVVSAW